MFRVVLIKSPLKKYASIYASLCINYMVLSRRVQVILAENDGRMSSPLIEMGPVMS